MDGALALRTEGDVLGPIDVPADALYGAHTQRALGNCLPISPPLHAYPELLVALAQVKAAAAEANRELGVLDDDIAEAIVKSANEVAGGSWHDQFPLPVVQGGGGTATNMNMNEVVANRACELLGGRRGQYEPVKPLDHVNRSQSTNDAYPTALSIAALRLGSSASLGLDHLAQAFDRKAEQYSPEAMRLGRTCKQDALPVSVRDTHASHAFALRQVSANLRAMAGRLAAVPLGATAVGTGFGAPPRYKEIALANLAGQTRLDLTAASHPGYALAHVEPYVAVVQSASRAASVMAKIAEDFRFLSSGPVGGIGELALPPVQIGSSAMRGKFNPVIPEFVIQAGIEVRAAETVATAVASAGELELNPMLPVMTRHLLGSLRTVAESARLFADSCVDGLTWNLQRVAENLAGSFADAVSVPEPGEVRLEEGVS